MIMPRKLAALLSALTLAFCYARAGFWVAGETRGETHACCAGGAPTKSAAAIDCCVTPAAAGSVHVVRVDSPAMPAALPSIHAAPFFAAFVPATAAPWRGRADRAAAPARAPPAV